MDINKVGITLPQVAQPSGTKKDAPLQSFGDVLKSALQSTVEAQKTAESLTAAVAQGEDVPVHKVVAAVSAAELKLQTLVTVRDRAVQAYQQLTQMPI